MKKSGELYSLTILTNLVARNKIYKKVLISNILLLDFTSGFGLLDLEFDYILTCSFNSLKRATVLHTIEVII